MYNWLKKYIDPVIPLFSIVPLLSCFALNMLVYSGSMVLCADWHHYDLTTWLDKQVPLVPQWMYIYFGCYLFWIINYMTDMMSRLVCAAFYIGFPTTNVRPAFTVDSFSDWLLAFLYRIDQPTNLFPSIHCLVSWLCYAGIRKSDKVSSPYKAFSCIFALLVAASTQFTKQHYLADAVAGIALAEFLLWINNRISAYQIVKSLFDRLNYKLLTIIGKGGRCEQ